MATAAIRDDEIGKKTLKLHPNHVPEAVPGSAPPERRRQRGKSTTVYHLFGTVGMCLMSSAIELVPYFCCPGNLVDLDLTCWQACGRREASSGEASLKYFLLGSFATAFFLYGCRAHVRRGRFD